MQHVQNKFMAGLAAVVCTHLVIKRNKKNHNSNYDEKLLTKMIFTVRSKYFFLYHSEQIFAHFVQSRTQAQQGANNCF